MKNTKHKMTKIIFMHYLKLIFRSALFILATATYIYNAFTNNTSSFMGFENNYILLSVIWLVFILEMLLRFFPAKLESMGCQKQFKKNFIPANNNKVHLTSGKTTFIVALLWLLLNGILGAFYLCGIITRGIMLLIALFYSVCDVICILFYCPFQTHIMKNKCCGTCRIYNWDYAMMFTPLVFVKNPYSWSLLAVAVLLLIKWEYTARKYPERFLENSNLSLSCAKCNEKLCQHKTQLQNFLKKRGNSQ